MPNRVRILALTDADRAKLERRARDRGAQARVAERARIVLLVAERLTGRRSPGGSGARSRRWSSGGGSTPKPAWPGWKTPRAGRAAQGADRQGDQRDPVGDGHPAAGCPAGGRGDALVVPAAGRVAAPFSPDRGQSRLHYPAMAPVLPGPAS